MRMKKQVRGHDEVNRNGNVGRNYHIVRYVAIRNRMRLGSNIRTAENKSDWDKTLGIHSLKIRKMNIIDSSHACCCCC